ncbi:MAG: peptide ABC transporter substrate-binding protein [Steroidobacteraceae bacterium]|nr:peptide ABC transporter substrate-binding protein [Steroidobacteraceae bacterium]
MRWTTACGRLRTARPAPFRLALLRLAPPRLVLLGLAMLGTLEVASAATLRRGAYGEPESLVPRESGVASEQVILRDLFEGLSTHGPDGAVRPGSAESWEMSPDGRRYTFRLRPGLKWSDGQPLTAQDFAWGWRYSLEPANAAARATRLYVIRGARAIHAGRDPSSRLGVATPDARTLVVELEYPLPSLPLLFAGEEGFPLPRHAIERHRAAWTRPGNHVGNGAFRLAERRARGAILLQRNPHFHAAGEVALDTVQYLPSDDLQSMVARFRAGSLEVNGWPGFQARQADALRRELGEQVRVGPLQSVRYLRFNVAQAPFDDVRVRRALSLAVDREVLARRVLGGGERAALRAVPDGLAADRAPADNPLAAGTQAARTAEARALLATPSIRARLPSQIRLRVPSGNGEELCLAIAAMWTAAGAPARPEQSEIKSMIADLRRGSFDVALTGAQDTPATESYLERFRPDSSYNTGRWENPAFVTALDAALRLPDPAARAQGMLAAERVLMHDHAVVPLYQEVARNLVARRVRGWVDNPGDIHLSRYLALQ